MVKNLDTTFKTELGRSLLRMAACLKITRADATEYHYTTWDSDLVIDGDTYAANPGIKHSETAFSGEGDVGSMTIELPYKSDGITKANVLARLFDEAVMEVYIVDPRDLPSSVGSAPYEYVLYKYYWAEVTAQENYCRVQCESLLRKLERVQGELLSPTCRAVFLDSRCNAGNVLTAADYTKSAVVAAVSTQYRVFTATDAGSPDLIDTNGYYSNGVVEWTSGDNNGVSGEVLLHTYAASTHTFKLFIPTPFEIAATDGFDVTAGCDKRTTTCKTKFAASNIVNFRGEPFVPGRDVVGQIPD